MTPLKTHFKERLIEVIGEESVSSFGRRCQISESSLRTSLGGALPRLDKLIAIASAANVTIEWLATGNGPMRPGEECKRDKQEAIQQPGSADPIDYADFRISEKMQKTIEILESETIYRPALAANIDAFHHGMLQEKVVQEQAESMKGLGKRMEVLEKYIASASVTPDDHRSKSDEKVA